VTGRICDSGQNILQYLAQMFKRETDDHPVPSNMAVEIFLLTTTEWLTLDLHVHTLSFCCVSEQLIASDKHPQKAIKIAFIQKVQFLGDCY